MKVHVLVIFLIAGIIAADAQLSAGAADFALRYALNSREAKAALAEIEVVEQTDKAENSLRGIEVEGEYKIGYAGDRRWGVSVGQEFEWPGVYSARRKAGRFRSEAYRHLYRAAVREQWVASAEALINEWQTEQQYWRLDKALDNMRRLDSIYTRMLARGETTLLETKKIALQLAALENRYDRAFAAWTAAKMMAQNYAMVSGQKLPEAALDASAELPPYLDYLGAWLTQGNSKSLEGFYLAANEEIKVARRKALPSFRLAYVHDYEDHRHFNGIGLSISLPTWTPRHAEAAAKADVSKIQQEISQQALQGESTLKVNYLTAHAYAERIKDSKALYDMEDYPALLQKALDAGRITLMEYLTEFNFYLETVDEFDYLRADYARARIKIDQYLISDELTD